MNGWTAEPGKTVLRRATPVARERAPAGANPQPTAKRRMDSQTQEKAAHPISSTHKSLNSESGT
jgi:hypothetical protein